MNSKDNEEMRDEYELRPGVGVRGKYYERYIQGATLRLTFVEGSSVVASTTSSALSVGVITKSQFTGGRLLASVHAG